MCFSDSFSATLKTIRTKLLRAKIVIPLGLIVLLGYARYGAAGFYLNIAQIQRLHNTANLDLFRRASELDPSLHNLWQEAAAIAPLGDKKHSLQLLAPYLDTDMPISVLGSVLLWLGDQHAYERLNQICLRSNENCQLVLQEPTALNALMKLLSDQQTITHEIATSVLARALNIPPYSPELSLLADQKTKALNDDTFVNQMRTTGQWLLRRQAGDIPKYSCDHCDDPAILDEFLQSKAITATLGEELATNGDFSSSQGCSISLPCSINAWEASYMANGNPWNRGIFVLGIDNDRFGPSARIDGVLIEHRPDREPARSGFWHSPITVTSQSYYILSFLYKTSNTTDSGPAATFYLSDNADALVRGDINLPNTHGKWVRFFMIAQNKVIHSTTVTPLLRSFSTGSVWYSRFSMRQIVGQEFNDSIPTTPLITYKELD